MTLKKIKDNLFTFEFDFKLMPGLTFPTRTVFTQHEDTMFVVSPGPFNEHQLDEIRKLANNFVLVAPNMFHHTYLVQARTLLDAVSVYGPQKLSKTKQPLLENHLRDINLWNDEQSESGLQAFFLEGHPFLSETVFLHNDSKTLLTTDILFHMNEPMPLSRKIVLMIAGAYNKPAQSKLIKKSCKDRKTFSQSIRKLFDLDFEHALIAHGEPLLKKETFVTTLDRVLSKY